MLSPTYANTFGCKIKDIASSMSAQKYVQIFMACNASNPISSGTNGCTSALVSNNSFTFDVSTEHGRMNLSLLMMAFASGKRIYVSTYATCPASMSNTPILYGIKVYGDE